MSLGPLGVMSVGLAMDAMAVSATRGFAAKRLRLRDACKVALLFGGFQAGMPALGYLLGEHASRWIQAYQHWAAFALLALIGGKMILEGFAAPSSTDDDEEVVRDPFGWGGLTVLAVATSIDAFAAGLTLPLFGVALPVALACIGGVTAALCLLGVYVGHRVGDRFGKQLGVFGGVVLVLLGVKILLEGLGVL